MSIKTNEIIMGLFDVFRKKQKNSTEELIVQQSFFDSFNILDETAWISASDNAFVWKDNTFHDKTNENKCVSEKDIIILLSWVMRQIDTVFSLPTTKLYGRETIIAEFLDGLVEGIPNEVILGKIVQRIPYEHRLFNIFDFESWEFASNNFLLWNGTMLYGNDKKPITEQDVVGLFHAIWRFLEKNGETLSEDDKIKSLKTVLDRMAKYQSDPNGMERAKNEFLEDISENITEEVSKFNPRNQETYQYATNRQLIIDGKEVWTPMYKDDQKIKSPVSETSFVIVLKALWNIHCTSQKAWDMAVLETKKEFESKGIVANDETPGYKEKSNELFQKIKKQLYKTIPEKIDQDFIEDRIYSHLWDMDRRKSIRKETK
jgi:hypothetical protein